jgi:uncharacterized protein VirK/YbjX
MFFAWSEAVALRHTTFDLDPTIRWRSAAMFVPALMRDVAVGAQRLASVQSVTRRRIARLARSEPLLTLLYRHGQVVQRLMSGRAAVLTTAERRSTTKYLRAYISISLDHVARRGLLLAQHEFLNDSCTDQFFIDMANGCQPIWNYNISEDRNYSIWLRPSTYAEDGEGDFVLDFRSSRSLLYRLLFNFGPCLTDDTRGAALLIACIQGRHGCLEEIGKAARDCVDTSPALLLLSAAEGIAMAWRIRTICGVSDGEQLSKNKTGIWFGYDQFWESHCGHRCHDWYQLPVPLPHKPLSSASAENRKRIRRRRRFKEALRDAVCSAMEAKYFQPPAGALPDLQNRTS